MDDFFIFSSSLKIPNSLSKIVGIEDFEKTSNSIQFTIHEKTLYKKRKIPKGLLGLIDERGNNIINNDIKEDIVIYTKIGNISGELTNKISIEDIFYPDKKIIRAFKISCKLYGCFIIYEDWTAQLIINGSGMRYVSFEIGKISRIEKSY